MMDKISDFTLERYLLKELPGRQLEEITRRLESDPQLKQRLQALEQSNAEILKQYPSRQMSHLIKTQASVQARAKAPARRLGFMPLLGLAAAATVVVAVSPYLWDNLADTTRTKGAAASLFIYRKLPSGAELLKNKAVAKPGDLLQIAYLSQQDGCGVILSLDGRGAVTLHYPAGDQSSTQLTVKRKTVLPLSYELDDAPGFERFFLITSPSELPVAAIMASARQLARDARQAMNQPLALPQGASQISFLVRKGE